MLFIWAGYEQHLLSMHQASGSTAVACMWKGNVVITANAGDSR